MTGFSVNSITRFFENKQEQKSRRPKKVKRERRDSTKDRRQSVNDGVIVTLSTREDKRSGLDRRRP